MAEVYRRFRGFCCLRLYSTLIIEGAGSSQASIHVYQVTRTYISKGKDLGWLDLASKQ